MSCEKYSGWMTEASLGELRAEREPESLAHAVECDACREALARARAVHDFVDRRVAALVAGEPSHHFATRLRRRIAGESEPLRFPWPVWAPVVAGTLALAVVLTIIVARRPVHTGSNPSAASSVNPVNAPPAALTASAATPQNTARTRSQRDSNRGTRAGNAAAVLPEIIVPKGQLAAAIQLGDAINSGRVDGNQLLTAQREYEKPLEVKPIVIIPLETPALEDATEKPASSIHF
jgi:hypothetical protein